MLFKQDIHTIITPPIPQIASENLPNLKMRLLTLIANYFHFICQLLELALLHVRFKIKTGFQSVTPFMKIWLI